MKSATELLQTIAALGAAYRTYASAISWMV
jgi:hypothetical protein